MLNLLAEEGRSVGSIVIFAILIVAIIGLFVWSSISTKKKQKQAQETLNSLKVGDRVKTIGGVCGFVVEINDGENTFVLETGLDNNKSYVKFDKGAIYQTAPHDGSNVESKTEETPEEVKAETPVDAPVSEEKVEEKPEEVKTEEVKKTPRKRAKKEEDLL